jgi:hypothetical protein
MIDSQQEGFVQCNWKGSSDLVSAFIALGWLEGAKHAEAMEKIWDVIFSQRFCFRLSDLGTRDSDVFQSWRALGFAQRVILPAAIGHCSSRRLRSFYARTRAELVTERCEHISRLCCSYE